MKINDATKHVKTSRPLTINAHPESDLHQKSAFTNAVRGGTHGCHDDVTLPALPRRLSPTLVIDGHLRMVVLRFEFVFLS